MNKKRVKPESQVLLIVRHAHRDKKQGREVDNGLSLKGNKQAKNVKQYFEKKFGRRKPVILSSPKRRCLETVEKIAKKTKSPIEVSDLLDEGGNINKKVSSIIEKVGDYPGCPIVICSHGDIIPSLIGSLVHVDIELDKGGIVQIEKKDGRYLIDELIQNFDFVY